MGMQKNQWLYTTMDLHPTCLFWGRTEWRRKNPSWMADGGAKQNEMAFSQQCWCHQPPPPSTPVIAGLLDVKSHLRKSSIGLSFLVGFHPVFLVIVLPSHHLFTTAVCCISSWHPLIAPPSCRLVAPAACCIASCCPLVVLPSLLLITPAGCCRRSSCPKPEIQHDRRGRSMPTLTWEEVTSREGKRSCCSWSKKEIMSLGFYLKVIYCLCTRSCANRVGFCTIPYIQVHILGVGLSNIRKHAWKNLIT